MQTGYSRREFSEKFGIAAPTLRSWEDGKNEITEKGLSRYIEALNKAGLVTTRDWLINGSGIPPRPMQNNSISLNNQNVMLLEEEIILREVIYFESINPNSIIVTISDDTMEPFFNLGDYVGGNMISGEYASKYIGTFCIIVLDDNETVVKKIGYGTKSGLFNLISVNTSTKFKYPFLLDRKISKLAQIVWHRRPEHTTNLD